MEWSILSLIWMFHCVGLFEPQLGDRCVQSMRSNQNNSLNDNLNNNIFDKFVCPVTNFQSTKDL